jgi:hypothetical protein
MLGGKRRLKVELGRSADGIAGGGALDAASSEGPLR